MEGRGGRATAKVLGHIRAWVWVAGTKASLEKGSEGWGAVGGDVLEAGRGKPRGRVEGPARIRSLEASGKDPGQRRSPLRALAGWGAPYRTWTSIKERLLLGSELRVGGEHTILQRVGIDPCPEEAQSCG